MCKYCNQGKTLLHIPDKGVEVYIYANSNFLVMRNNWDLGERCVINYCPMCGRDLRKPIGTK